MALSDEDKTRIEEEEYRKMARERLERTVRLEADIRSRGDQRLEVRGVGTEIYRDAKSAAAAIVKTGALVVAIVMLLAAVWGIVEYRNRAKRAAEWAAPGPAQSPAPKQ